MHSPFMACQSVPKLSNIEAPTSKRNMKSVCAVPVIPTPGAERGVERKILCSVNNSAAVVSNTGTSFLAHLRKSSNSFSSVSVDRGLRFTSAKSFYGCTENFKLTTSFTTK